MSGRTSWARPAKILESTGSGWDAAGVDTSLVQQVPDKFTASFFCSTDADNNQIASFYTGAMAHAAELSIRTVHGPGLVIVSPNDPAAMIQYAEECRTLRIPYIFDPGQQCARMSGPELQDGVGGAQILICNDYEFELIRQKTAMSETEVLAVTDALVVTRGEQGSSNLPGRQSSGREGGAAPPNGRSHRRWRCVSRRVHERDGG